MSKKGLVYFQDMRAGILSESDEGYEFTYTADYLESKNAKPVSLTLPLRLNDDLRPTFSQSLFDIIKSL